MGGGGLTTLAKALQQPYKDLFFFIFHVIIVQYELITVPHITSTCKPKSARQNNADILL